MIQIALTNPEIGILRKVLVSHLAELRLEIACTDRREFREFLYKRRDFMEEFVQRLEKELEAGGREMIGSDRLKKVDILQGLTEWELQAIAPFFREENFGADATLCGEGEKAQRMYILEQGRSRFTPSGGKRMKSTPPERSSAGRFLFLRTSIPLPGSPWFHPAFSSSKAPISITLSTKNRRSE